MRAAAVAQQADLNLHVVVAGRIALHIVISHHINLVAGKII